MLDNIEAFISATSRPIYLYRMNHFRKNKGALDLLRQSKDDIHEEIMKYARNYLETHQLEAQTMPWPADGILQSGVTYSGNLEAIYPPDDKEICDHSWISDPANCPECKAAR